ncbi:MAG: glycoside hydrolase family 2 [Pirellulales bacterium]|nr:glycoside hydrolase family 2 [Pirellulales bacterium]
MRIAALTLSTVLILACDTVGQTPKWEPAVGPLTTRWAKDVSPERVHPEYPRPQMVRPKWRNLNGVWQLAAGRSDQNPPIGVHLPGTVLVPFPIESALSGVMRQTDRAWYRRTFEVPADWKDQDVLLHFGAVDWEATVWLNGKKLGTHRGGYDAFSFDITEALKPDGPQELLVRVFDPTDNGSQPRGKQITEPKGIYYTPATGIWQTVWIEPVPKTRITRLKMTPDIDRSCLHLTVEGHLTGGAHSIRATVRDGQREIAHAFGGLGGPIKLDIPRDQLTLWSPENPKLYDLTVTLTETGETIDEVSSYFGMRKIAIGKDEKGVMRLLLNGRFVFQMGPLDQGYWPDGIYTAPTDEALRYDIEMTKRLGFNMVRKHVKVEPARWYYWCDKLGLLVWQDMPSGNNKTPEAKHQYEVELHRMVEGFRNHPSIVMWIVFNEGWGQFDTKRLTEQVKTWDPSRLVSNASGWTDEGVGDVRDIHKYPGPGAPKPETARAGVLGEFGGLGLPIQGHVWPGRAWGYRQMGDPRQLDDRYIRLMRRVWELDRSSGLSAAVYTQLTDVETEANGLMTYDRGVLKVDAKQVAAANAGRVPSLKFVVPTAEKQPGLDWRYTLKIPSKDWYASAFNDATWQQGPAGFGKKGTPGAVVRTEWTDSDIWLRRTVTLPTVHQENMVLLVHHDEDAEIYINGVLAARLKGHTTGYEEVTIDPKALVTIAPGKNLLAVHCHQTEGGQYIDLGLAELVPAKEE